MKKEKEDDWWDKKSIEEQAYILALPYIVSIKVRLEKERKQSENDHKNKGETK